MANICVLLPCHWGAARGGAEYQSHLLAEYLKDNSPHEVTYLANRTPEILDEYRYEVSRFAGPKLPGGLRWGRISDSLSLLRALRALQPDVIIHMVASAYTGIAAWYAQRSGALLYWYIASDLDVAPVPNVGIEGPAGIIDRRLFLYGLRHADYIVAQTETQVQMLRKNHGRMAELTIPNFLPPVELKPRCSKQFTVSWIANIKGLKRPELFVELARSLREEEGITFRMAGRITEHHLSSVVDDASSELPNFTYLGELSLNDVEKELEGSDVFINTSDYEGFPNTFIQAWLRAVPVLSLNVDPDGDMERNGIGYRAGDIDHLRAFILKLKSDRESRLLMGARARDYALSHHSLANAEQLRAHFENALVH